LLSDVAIEALFEQAEPQSTILALAGAGQQVAGRWLALLPPHEAERLRRAWLQLGPTPLTDIEAAQQKLVELACELGLSPVFQTEPV
jgi:flagellar motor switch protein FliG